MADQRSDLPEPPVESTGGPAVRPEGVAQDQSMAKADRFPLGFGAILFGLYVAFFMAAVLTIAYRSITGESGDATFPVLVLSLIGYWLGFAGVPVVLLVARGSRGKRLFDVLRLSIRPRDSWLGAVWGVFGQVILVTIIYLPLQLFGSDDLVDRISEPAKEVAAIASGWQVVPLAFALCVCAPIAEEVFFRGLVLRVLAQKWGPKVGIAGSAILFGLVHFEPLQTPGLIAFGVVLGILAHRSGRLGPSIVAHACFNLVTVISLVNTS